MDRDGVLIEEREYPDSVEELYIFPYVTECIQRIHKEGYYSIVVMSQSDVAWDVYGRRDYNNECVFGEKDFSRCCLFSKWEVKTTAFRRYGLSRLSF